MLIKVLKNVNSKNLLIDNVLNFEKMSFFIVFIITF